MSVWAVARGAGAVILLCAGTCSVAAQSNDAANAIADRFARDADAPKQQVKAKPSSQGKSTTAPKQDAQRKQDALRKQDAGDKHRATAEAARRSVEQRSADEADMLARARREAEEMKAAAEQTQLAEEARRLIIEAEQERAKAETLLERERQQTAKGRTTIMPPSSADAVRREAAEADARRAAIEAAEAERKAADEEKLAEVRREETRRLIAKLNRVRQIRDARLAAQQQRTLAEQSRREPPPSTPDASPSSPPRESRTATGVPTMAPPLPPPAELRMGLGGRDRVAGRLPETYRDDREASQFTVLLIMAPGNYGIRRNGPKVADPILCASYGCYVSEGADRPVRFLPVRKALGFGNTFGARAGACRQRLGCVFRGVDLGDMRGFLQPVDLHILKHDRRQPRQIAGDSACHTGSGHLVCDRGIYTQDYAMWIVPERMADAVGPVVLEEAVADGLNGPRSSDTFSLLGR